MFTSFKFTVRSKRVPLSRGQLRFNTRRVMITKDVPLSDRKLLAGDSYITYPEDLDYPGTAFNPITGEVAVRIGSGSYAWVPRGSWKVDRRRI
jgi:hypothetical protein